MRNKKLKTGEENQNRRIVLCPDTAHPVGIAAVVPIPIAVIEVHVPKSGRRVPRNGRTGPEVV